MHPNSSKAIRVNNPYIDKIEEFPEIIRFGLEKQTQWDIHFGNSNPLVVDIGCGAGNFLRDLAVRMPDRNYIGLELRYKRLVKGAEKFRKSELQNVTLVQAKGEEIDSFFAPGSISAIHINFPDPWAKKRQRKHRLVSLDYLKKLTRLLTEKGTIFFKTDHGEYYQYVISLVDELDFLEIGEHSENLYQSSFLAQNVRTEFEQLFVSKGFPIYYCKIIKK